MKKTLSLRSTEVLIALTACLLAVFVSPASATVIIGGDGIPISDGFYNLTGGGVLIGVSISQAVGGLLTVGATSSCLIGSTASCLAGSGTAEPNFTFKIVDSGFNGGGDTCAGSDTYSDQTVNATHCAFNHGGLGNTVGTSDSTDVQASGCNSWTATWTQQNSHIYYVDEPASGSLTTNVAFRMSGTLQLTNRNHTALGDVWQLTGTLTGVGYDQSNPHKTFTASWSIPNASVNTGVDCSKGDLSRQATAVSLSGSATVVHT